MKARPTGSAVVAAMAALLTAVALLVAAGSAEAAWLAPLAVSAEGLQARDPQVAIDGGGNVTVAWVSGTSSQDIFVAEHPAGGEWTAPVSRIAVSAACENPKLAVDSAGAAIVVADCGTGGTLMRSASRTVNGTWSVSGEIPGTGNGEEPRVAMDDSGNAIVVWSASGTVQSNYRTAAGIWEGSAKQVSPVGKVSHEPDVTVSPTGRAIAVWLEDRDETVSDPVVQVDSISRQGAAAWSGFKFLSGTTTSTVPVATYEPQVTMGAGGRFAAWSQLGSPTPVLKNAWGSSSDFGAWGEGGSHISSDAAYEVESPRVALDASGRAVAVFRARKLENGDFVVRTASTSLINGEWSSQTTLATGGNGFTQPDVAVDPAGDAIAVWRIGATVSALRHPAGGSFSPPGTTISNSSHSGFEEPQVAMDGAGNGVAAWSAEGTSPTHVAVAVDDVTPPAITVAPVVPVALGTPAHLIAGATDTWSSPVTFSWAFGDGASASGASVSHAYATPGTKTATVTATDAAGNSATATAQVAVLEGPAHPQPPQPTPRRKVKVTAKPVPQPWAKIAAAKALKVRCKLDVSGTCSVTATVGAGVAKLLGLKGRPGKAVTIGRGSAQVRGGRFATVKVKLKAAALAAIDTASGPVPVSFAVKGTAGGRDDGSAKAKLKIPRP